MLRNETQFFYLLKVQCTLVEKVNSRIFFAKTYPSFLYEYLQNGLTNGLVKLELSSI